MELIADALLFDLDGTLVDSTPAVIRSWTAWAAERGITETQFAAIETHGRTSRSIVADLVPADQVDAADARIQQLELADLSGVTALPGAAELLTRLDPARWAVVTSGVRRLAAARLTAAGLPTPRVLVSADDVRRGKPDPEPYLAGAAALGIAPQRCVVVEDAPAGLTAARAAGMATVAVTGTHRPEELKADLVLPGLGQLSVTGSDRFVLTAA
ncbi:HAD-IA family hydrolase [Actinocatenispora thailandica]|uniref:HAD-IA family hydrolase n=1 Tax=Actinocatenispora thailandica TaxID=227318 RepID=UPI001EF24A23|nr:HAD-IA family hydrolase [Actinocatenispora thailandica]